MTARRGRVGGRLIGDATRRSRWYSKTWPVQTTVWAVSRFVMQDRKQVRQALADDQRPHGGHTPGFHSARVGLWALALVASLPVSLVGFLIAQALGNDGSMLESVGLAWVGVTGAAMLWNSVRAATGGSPPFDPLSNPPKPAPWGGRVRFAATFLVVVGVAIHQLLR
ncbi:MAG: hypothetical protein ACXVHC_00550 [Frankiaceae bacterium]